MTNSLAYFILKELKPNLIVLQFLKKAQVPSSIKKSVSSDCPAKEDSVVTKNSTLPPSQTAASSMAIEELPVSTQVFRDLMELAKDGMVLSQGSHSASCCDGGKVYTHTHTE